MPTFVPVRDVEKPRSAHDSSTSRSFDKHKKFDDPFSVPNKRGWDQGTVGWGVLGAFGSQTKDDGSNLTRKSNSDQKMIKNDRGLWVKADDANYKIAETSAGRGGRPLLALNASSRDECFEKIYASDITQDTRKMERIAPKNIRQRSSSRDRNVDSSRYYDNDRGNRRYNDKVDDQRDNKNRNEDIGYRNKPKYRRSRSRSSSRSKRLDRSRRRVSRSRSRSRSRSKSSSAPSQVKKRVSRSRSRSSSDSYERKVSCTKVEETSQSKTSLKEMKTTEEVNSDQEFHDECDDDSMRCPNAVQVINRFLEVFALTSVSEGERIDFLQEIFDKDMVVYSLKTGKPMISGIEQVLSSFRKTQPHLCDPIRRIYLEQVRNSSHQQESMVSECSTANMVTYCVDFYNLGRTPGLGDLSKSGVVLYQCEQGRIRKCWGCVDKDDWSQMKPFDRSTLSTLSLWRFIQNSIPCVDNLDIYFHDYDQIECWG